MLQSVHTTLQQSTQPLMSTFRQFPEKFNWGNFQPGGKHPISTHLILGINLEMRFGLRSGSLRK
jgi:hypothetical protein